MVIKNDEYKLLFARADDLLTRARGGEIAVSSFLNPAEAHYLGKYLAEIKSADSVIFFGGYSGASRTRAFFLPEYIKDLAEGGSGNEREKLILSYISEDVAAAVRAVRVKGSGYRTLSHRDYLGSILSLGIERHVIGDIAVLSEHEALVFADAKIADYILQTLTRVASDDVKCSAADIDENFTISENVEEKVISVASARVDCIVASLAKCSREEAQSLVKSGAVSADYEEINDPDKKIGAGTVISVRGTGKFRILDDGTKTGRARLRIKVQKFR